MGKRSDGSHTVSFITYENCEGFICEILPRKGMKVVGKGEMEKRKREKKLVENLFCFSVSSFRMEEKKGGLVCTLIYKAVYFKMGLRLTELEKARLFIYICIKMQKP